MNIQYFDYLREHNVVVNKEFKIMYSAISKLDKQNCILELGTFDIENKIEPTSGLYIPYKIFKSYGARST